MPNILDHVKQIGALSLEERAFDALDALILSQLVYLPMEGHVDLENDSTIAAAWEYLCDHVDVDAMDRFQQKRWKLYEACAEVPRYCHWVVCDYVNTIDDEREMQFCACTYRLPDGLSVIAYCGTDLSVAGWKEDLNMSFMTVPSQREAAEYITRAAGRTGDALILCGHSKGGNLSVYAASTTDPSTRERIRRVYTFDGPGVDTATLSSFGHQLVADRIESYIPQSSIVGMLLGYHPVYTVVEAQSAGILQHDAMTWQVKDGAFVTVAGVDLTGKMTDDTLHAWLKEMDMEERRLLVDTVCQVVDAAHAEWITDITSDWFDSAVRMLEAIRELPPDVKHHVGRFLQSLFSAGANEAVKLVLSALNGLGRGEE